MRRAMFCLLLALVFLPLPAGAKDWAGFYDRQRLLSAKALALPGILANFRETMWSKLTPEEQRRLGSVDVVFPLENAEHPMNFYSGVVGGKKTIVFPVSSLCFLSDMMQAHAWLDASGYSLAPITDYAAMLKYQWPPGKLAGRRYKPREALGIPDNALDDPKVHDKFQRLYGTAIVFILGHELGHLYYGHTPKVSPERSREQEMEADRFALELMRRIGDTPVGMVPLFYTFAHLDTYKSDSWYADERASATHPLSSARLAAAASFLKSHAGDFVYDRGGQLTVLKIASDIQTIATIFEDPGVQELIRNRGLSADPDQLGPRKVGASAPAGSAGPPTQAFSGRYVGTWKNAKGTGFDVTLSLTRTGTSVRGSYDFGAGTVSVEGTVDGGALHYDWKWGRDYFGKGVLEPDSHGQGLKGTWGYTRAESGAGTWALKRAE
jgi:Peptidase family M48